MKIEGPNKSSGAKGAGKAEQKKSGDGTFDTMISETGEAETPHQAARPSSLSPLDALLILQETGGSTSEEAAKKAKKRAFDLLDQLDKIKLGLLTGELPKSTIIQLSNTIAIQRDQVLDPRLAEVLDEIDLRAQVELAKLEQN
jgi:hypothetical protein